MEDEGVGTAYEYLVKYRLLCKIINKNENSGILIAGLPEKYGYSLDLIMFGKENSLNCEVVDERIEKINRLKQIFERTHKDTIPVRLCNLCDLENIYPEKHFDLAFSCEVLQRLSLDEQIQYIRSLKKIAKNIVLFVPNGDNKGHQVYSCLNIITRKELINHFNMADDRRHHDTGYIDMPPWPPGVRKNILKGVIGRKICSISLNILQIASAIEPFYPAFIKSGYAHLIYIIA